MAELTGLTASQQGTRCIFPAGQGPSPCSLGELTKMADETLESGLKS